MTPLFCIFSLVILKLFQDLHISSQTPFFILLVPKVSKALGEENTPRVLPTLREGALGTLRSSFLFFSSDSNSSFPQTPLSSLSSIRNSMKIFEKLCMGSYQAHSSSDNFQTHKNEEANKVQKNKEITKKLNTNQKIL
jgi:hypothetical protein